MASLSSFGAVCAHGAENTNVPFAREKVITCYGIIGILSLATSTSSHLDSSRDRHRRLSLTHSRLHPHHHRPHALVSTALAPYLPRHRLPPPPPLASVHLRDDFGPPDREGAHFARREWVEERKVVVFARLGPHEHASKTEGPGSCREGCAASASVAKGG